MAIVGPLEGTIAILYHKLVLSLSCVCWRFVMVRNQESLMLASGKRHRLSIFWLTTRGHTLFVRDFRNQNFEFFLLPLSLKKLHLFQ